MARDIAAHPSSATPPWARPAALGCTWVGTLATAALLVLVGLGIDGGLTPALTWLGGALVAVAAAASAAGTVASSRAVGTAEGRLRHRLVRAVYDAGVAGAGAGPSGQFLCWPPTASRRPRGTGPGSSGRSSGRSPPPSSLSA